MDKIGVLGPVGTYTEKAAKTYMKILGIEGELVYNKSLKKTFDSIGKSCEYGVIPIENTLDGFVQIILDLLTHSKLNIIHEIVLPIDFAFVSKGPIHQVTDVYAQFKSKNQCNDFLEEHLDKKVYITESNSESYRKVLSGQENIGAIIPMHLLGNDNKDIFKTIIKHVADSKDNETRFIVLTKEALVKEPLTKEPLTKKPLGEDALAKVVGERSWKTLLVIHDDRDRPGLLVDILNIFKDEGVNLLSIISRPTKKGLGNYNFFIDVQGCYQRNAPVKKAVERVTDEFKIRVLGSYYRIN